MNFDISTVIQVQTDVYIDGTVGVLIIFTLTAIVFVLKAVTPAHSSKKFLPVLFIYRQ